MNERRDYETNGIGWHQEQRRRNYDKTALESCCLNCGLRQEVHELEKRMVGKWVLGIIVTIFIAVLAAASSLNGVFIKSMVETQKTTLDAVHAVSERTKAIETWQEILAKNMADRNERRYAPKINEEK